MIKIDQYTTIDLEKYDGKFSIVEGWETPNGEFKKRWIKEESGKEKVERSFPKRIRIGLSRDVAIENLKEILNKLETYDDIPF